MSAYFAGFVVGFLVAIVCAVVVLVWERRQPVVEVIDGSVRPVPPRPREPLGVRHDRLDGEARVATSAPDFDANLKARWVD